MLVKGSQSNAGRGQIAGFTRAMLYAGFGEDGTTATRLPEIHAAIKRYR